MESSIQGKLIPDELRVFLLALIIIVLVLLILSKHYNDKRIRREQKEEEKRERERKQEEEEEEERKRIEQQKKEKEQEREQATIPNKPKEANSIIRTLNANGDATVTIPTSITSTTSPISKEYVTKIISLKTLPPIVEEKKDDLICDQEFVDRVKGNHSDNFTKAGLLSLRMKVTKACIVKCTTKSMVNADAKLATSNHALQSIHFNVQCQLVSKVKSLEQELKSLQKQITTSRVSDIIKKTPMQDKSREYHCTPLKTDVPKARQCIMCSKTDYLAEKGALMAIGNDYNVEIYKIDEWSEVELRKVLSKMIKDGNPRFDRLKQKQYLYNTINAEVLGQLSVLIYQPESVGRPNELLNLLVKLAKSDREDMNEYLRKDLENNN